MYGNLKIRCSYPFSKFKGSHCIFSDQYSPISQYLQVGQIDPPPLFRTIILKKKNGKIFQAKDNKYKITNVLT